MMPGHCIEKVAVRRYNQTIEIASKLYPKKQFVFYPLLALVVVDYQITLKITCKNEPAKRLKQPVLRGQGRNEDCPTEGIDTILHPCSST